MAVYAYNATTVAVECTGTDISSAGIKAFLDANPTYGSCVASTSGPKDSYIFTLLARFTIGTPSSFKGASVWNCSNEFVTLICAANQFITYGRITQGNLDAGLSQNGGAFCLDGSVAGQFRINGGDWFFYGSSLYASQRIDTSAPSGNLPDVRLLDCDLELEDSITPDGGGSYNYTNSRIHHTGAVGLKNQTGSGATYNLSGLRIQRCNYAFQPVGTQTISDVKIDSCTSHLIPNLVDVDITFVNPDFTVLRASNINSLDVVRIEFRYQLKITDAAGAALPGISVRARDAAGSFRFDTLTNASGNPTTFPSGTLQNSTYVGTTTAPSSSSAVTRTDRAAHTIRVRHPQYLWTDLIRSATVDNLGDATPLVPDALFTMSPAAAAAITGVTITDHAGSPVSWNSKSWGITITGDTSVNPSLTAADIFHYIRYMTSYTASFGGKSGLDWHNMLQNMATTVRSGSSFYAGVLKGVRVVNQAGDPFAGVLSMMADDGTTYSPLPVTTSTITLSGVIPGSRVQLFDTANGVELLNSTSLYGFSETYSVDRTFRVRVSYQSGTSAKHFIEANIGSITGANPNLTYLVNQTDDTVGDEHRWRLGKLAADLRLQRALADHSGRHQGRWLHHHRHRQCKLQGDAVQDSQQQHYATEHHGRVWRGLGHRHGGAIDRHRRQHGQHLPDARPCCALPDHGQLCHYGRYFYRAGGNTFGLSQR